MRTDVLWLACLQSNFSVTIDLLQLLGNQQFFAGISWDPMACYPGWKVRLKP